jgi:hypothetical protein
MESRFQYKKKELDLFWWWINERHRIYLKKEARDPWPWTDSKVLQKYKFTNAFRQLDAVTQEWTARWQRDFNQGAGMTHGDILFAVCLFRFFNWPRTFDVLRAKLGDTWSKSKAITVLNREHKAGRQLFTGAYIVSSGGEKQPKHLTIIDALDHVFKQREMYGERIRYLNSMQGTVVVLQNINTVGPFVAYEIACDLRFTPVLAHAAGKLTWANAGPGAMRGIHRLLTGKVDKPKKRIDYNAAMVDLWNRSSEHLEAHVRDCELPFELREIEHSLCEYDKLRRVQRGEGAPRSLYRPPAWAVSS